MTNASSEHNTNALAHSLSLVLQKKKTERCPLLRIHSNHSILLCSSILVKVFCTDKCVVWMASFLCVWCRVLALSNWLDGVCGARACAHLPSKNKYQISQETTTTAPAVTSIKLLIIL